MLLPPTLIQSPRSALKEIEKQSLELLEKGTVAWFVDKAGDSENVAGLIERLREAITHYQVSQNCFVALSRTHTGEQVSQQQAIYNQISNLTVRMSLSSTVTLTIDSSIKSSFDVLLNLHEVCNTTSSPRYRLTLGQSSPSAKNKLDSIMVRLDRLCSEEDLDDSGHAQWAKLFEWVVGINSSPRLC